jgi:hypothetical protein
MHATPAHSRGHDARKRAGPNVDALCPLSEAKLAAPREPPRLVDRPRLLRALDAASGVRPTLVAAPAGSSKSTAVRALCARREARNAWLTLDVRDDEPVRLWTYVAAALERMCPGADASRRRRAAAHGRQGTGPRGPRRRRGRRADRRRPHPRQRPHGARGTATELDLADRVHPPSTEEPHDEQFSRGVLAARLGGRELRATGPARVAAGDGDVRVVPRGFVGGEPHTVGVAYTASPEGEQALRSGVVAVDAAIAEPAAHSKARSTSCAAIRPRRGSDSPARCVCS